MMAKRRMFIGAITLLTLWLRAVAHDSPSHVIHSLTHRMETEGASARLLTARAYEHRSLGDLNAAIVDFTEALKLKPHYSAALLGNAETLLSEGRWSEAEAVARQGVDTHSDVARQAPYQALLGKIHAGQHRWPEAREAWHAALRSPTPEVDWFLGEAESAGRLSGPAAQVRALAEAVKRNPSIVLRRAWIRALIDAGELEPASREIENSLTETRWRSTWLLMRARIHEQRGELAKQRADATEALTEIRSRMNPDRPDPYLVAEAGNALALLGEQDEARAYLQQARGLGVPEALLSVRN